MWQVIEGVGGIVAESADWVGRVGGVTQRQCVQLAK